MKFFCFRFDVDTHRCIKKGVPNLLMLSRRLGVTFTFFINMGKGTSRWIYLKKRISRFKHSPQEKRFKLSNLKKLGAYDYFVTLLLNPTVGSSSPDIIQDAYSSGHEIGLHGGTNHGVWQYEGSEWSEEKIRAEVSKALENLQKLPIEIPVGFSSPGWNGCAKLHRVLESMNFKYVADAHGIELNKIEKVEDGPNLYQVPTNILGEPGGIGYIENLRAQGMDDKEILIRFEGSLEGKKTAVVYEHPCYAGVQELPLVEKMVCSARTLGFRTTTLKNIIGETCMEFPK